MNAQNENLVAIWDIYDSQTKEILTEGWMRGRLASLHNCPVCCTLTHQVTCEEVSSLFFTNAKSVMSLDSLIRSKMVNINS